MKRMKRVSSLMSQVRGSWMFSASTESVGIAALPQSIEQIVWRDLDGCIGRNGTKRLARSTLNMFRICSTRPCARIDDIGEDLAPFEHALVEHGSDF